MSQPNRVGRRISPRSLAGHERLPVRLSHVASANRYLPYSAYLICGLGKVDDLASNKRLLLRCLMLRIVFAEEYTVEKVSVSCLEFRLDVNLYGHVQVIVR